MPHETFFTLLGDSAHWEFELFLMVIFDVVLGMILWPFLKRHWTHHILSDKLHGFDKKKRKTTKGGKNHG